MQGVCQCDAISQEQTIAESARRAFSLQALLSSRKRRNPYMGTAALQLPCKRARQCSKREAT